MSGTHAAIAAWTCVFAKLRYAVAVTVAVKKNGRVSRCVDVTTTTTRGRTDVATRRVNPATGAVVAANARTMAAALDIAATAVTAAARGAPATARRSAPVTDTDTVTVRARTDARFIVDVACGATARFNPTARMIGFANADTDTAPKIARALCIDADTDTDTARGRPTFNVLTATGVTRVTRVRAADTARAIAGDAVGATARFNPTARITVDTVVPAVAANVRTNPTVRDITAAGVTDADLFAGATLNTLAATAVAAAARVRAICALRAIAAITVTDTSGRTDAATRRENTAVDVTDDERGSPVVRVKVGVGVVAADRNRPTRMRRAAGTVTDAASARAYPRDFAAVATAAAGLVAM